MSSSDKSSEKIIPSSRRPDGTFRKEIRVRPGYVPQEEVTAFETTASKLKKKGIPGFVRPADDNNTTGPGRQENLSRKPQHSNNESTQAVKKEPVKSIPQVVSKTPNSAPKLSESFSSMSINTKSDDNIPADKPLPSEAESKAKRIKAIKKKLREISELEAKLHIGATLSMDESEKIGRKEGLERELKDLESAR